MDATVAVRNATAMTGAGGRIGKAQDKELSSATNI